MGSLAFFWEATLSNQTINYAHVHVKGNQLWVIGTEKLSAHRAFLWIIRYSISYCFISLSYIQQGMLMFKVAFSLFSNINNSPCRALDWVFNGQSDFDWVFYMHNWEFLIHKKIIAMLTCPIQIKDYPGCSWLGMLSDLSYICCCWCDFCREILTIIFSHTWQLSMPFRITVTMAHLSNSNRTTCSVISTKLM